MMDHDEEPTMLPGFAPERTSDADSGLRAAALATIEALRADGVLTTRHALTAQLLLATSERAGIGLQSGKTTIATTNLLRLLSELLDRLPVDEALVADGADSFLRALADAEATARAQKQ